MSTKEERQKIRDYIEANGEISIEQAAAFLANESEASAVLDTMNDLVGTEKSYGGQPVLVYAPAYDDPRSRSDGSRDRNYVLPHHRGQEPA